VTVRTLHLLGSPVLRQQAAPVRAVDEEVRQLVDDLFETMRAAKGVGLAANQIGVARRVAVVDVGEDDPPPLAHINPVIVERSEEHETSEEGCLSIPDIFGDGAARAHIVVEALDVQGQPYRVQAHGYKARAIQHEIDHLDGILFLDHVSAVKRALLLSKWKKSRKGEGLPQGGHAGAGRRAGVRVVFFGTPDFAVPSLRALVGEGFDVVAVVTQPDAARVARART
jgi:peptide deformylase